MNVKFSLAAATFLVIAIAAHADTLVLGSYGSTATTPSGVANGAVYYNGTSATYNLPTNGVWFGPLANSNWVSLDPGTYPDGPVVEPNGTYTYTTSFTDFASSTGSLTVLADDTTDVFLNGFMIAGDGSGSATHCTVTTPNCTVSMTYALPEADFLSGLNTLTFNVQQLYGNGTGLDFDGSVTTSGAAAVTPEPSTFMLLGTGFLGIAGVLKRRIATP